MVTILAHYLEYKQDCFNFHLDQFLYLPGGMADAGCFRLSLIVLAFATLVACSSQRSGPTSLEGTQSTGGGDASVSTPDQVNSAIDRALALATESNSQKNIYVQFWKARVKLSKTEFLMHPAHVFPNVDSLDESTKFQAPFIQALKSMKIVRLNHGDCPHPADETTAAASVSDHSFNATLCFSVGNLSRIPQSSLQQEVSALLLHEITHMGGADEPEAKAWQSEFLSYFAARFGNILAGTDVSQSTLLIANAYALLARAQKFADQDLHDRHVLADMVAAVETISSLPDSSDELALELKINPVHPELIANYVRAVQQVSAMRSKIEWHGIGSVVQVSKAYSAMKTNPIFDQDLDVKSALIELKRGVDEVNECFLAFTQTIQSPNDVDPQNLK